MKVFLDTSAFAMRYVAEVGSDKVIAPCRPDVFVSADHRQLAAARKAGLKIIDVS